MPIEVGIWRVDGEDVTRVVSSKLGNEERLEDILEQDVSILGLDVLLIIGRQVTTDFGKRIDLFAVDSQGVLYAIELKRHRTPREIVAQLLDYGSWLRGLDLERISEMYARNNVNESFSDAFVDHFGEAVPETLNESQQLIIVASELDASTERIVSYLTDFGVPINAVFFRYFKDGDREYLARSWLLDPVEAEGRARRAGRKGKAAWNGQDFYVSFGVDQQRTWEDARRYGFISGGGGKWHSQSLNALEPGHRVFVNIPKVGFVGVGEVEETVVHVKDFTVNVDGSPTPILEAPLKATAMGAHADDPDLSEYVVAVKWLTTIPETQAIWEPGMFANQHTACRLQGEKGEFTIARVSERMGVDETG
ncbi:MAG: DUF91 domain-containing protein [Actinobacteria bacterium]|nr:DUF91 domain-containing protein [Actinomycetota bacterium]